MSSEIHISLSKYFYEFIAIEDATKDFSEWCDGVVEDDKKGSYYKVALQLKKEIPQEFTAEFCNRCLEYSKKYFPANRGEMKN